jgi:hypothetical protein
MQNLPKDNTGSLENLPKELSQIFDKIKENGEWNIKELNKLSVITQYFKKINDDFLEYEKYKKNQDLQNAASQSLGWIYAIKNLIKNSNEKQLARIIDRCDSDIKSIDETLNFRVNLATIGILSSLLLPIGCAIALAILPLKVIALLPPVIALSILSLVLAFPLCLSIGYQFKIEAKEWKETKSSAQRFGNSLFPSSTQKIELTEFPGVRQSMT